MNEPTVEFLISAMCKNPVALIEEMNVPCNAVVVNQTDAYGFHDFRTAKGHIRCFNCGEVGVGRSRNTALMHAKGDILVFADEDICYVDGVDNVIVSAFNAHPNADMLIFDFDFYNAQFGRNVPKAIPKVTKVHSFNYMRYGAPRIAVRAGALWAHDLLFSLQFGGGAKYSCGEDTIFLHDCVKSGLNVLALPIVLGHLNLGTSSWFDGYNEKFFFDRGVLNRRVAGCFHWIVSLRYLIMHLEAAKSKVGVCKALSLLLRGGRVKTC